jgi:hypothetical protein
MAGIMLDLLLIGVFTSLPVFAEDRTSESKWIEEAAKIINGFGGGDIKLSKEEMKAYLNSIAFKTIDLDEDGALYFEEYIAAYLYCDKVIDSAGRTTWDCNADTAKEKYSRDTTGLKSKAIDAIHLMKNSQNVFWQEHIKQLVDAHWGRACNNKCGTDLDLNSLARYLQNEEKLKPKIRSAKNRVARLTKEIGGRKDVRKDNFRVLYFDTAFDDADIDNSNHLDILEIKKKYDHPQVIKEFIEYSDSDFHLSKTEFLQLAANLNTQLGRLLDHALDLEWDRIAGSVPSVKLEGNLDAVLARQEEEAREAARKQVVSTVAGFDWVKDRGIILAGKPIYSKEKKVFLLDESQPIFTLRVIKDFTKAGDKAESATLNWTKDAGGDSVFGVNAAFRFDYYVPSWYDQSEWTFRPAIGLELDKSGKGKDKEDIQKYFLAGDWYINHGSDFIGSSYFQFGPVIERDLHKKVDKITGFVEWEPYLRIGRISTGVWHKFGFLSVFARPRVAIELDDVLRKPRGQSTSDNSFLRYGIQVGLSLFDDTTITYELKQRNSLEGFRENHFFQEMQVEWALNKEKQYSITFNYKNGEDRPTFTDVEKYSIGFGVKF